MPRINRCVELLDQGQPVYYDRVNVPDLGYEYGRDICRTWADYLRIEFEHISMDTGALYDFMRGLKDAGPTRSGHLTPAVMCTIPATGMSADEVRFNAWQIRHILSAECMGSTWRTLGIRMRCAFLSNRVAIPTRSKGSVMVSVLELAATAARCRRPRYGASILSTTPIERTPGR